MQIDSNKLLTKDTQLIFDVLEEQKAQVRFVGGCVRDFINKQEMQDIDFATTLAPEEVLKAFTNKDIKCKEIGLKFGTVMVIINKKSYEVTTLRKDIECYGRHAKVAFTDDWKEDAKRRDFTINALSCDRDGKIYDYFSGIQDLAQGKVKFIGNPKERVQEDYLRILRFFRFYAYYGKTEPEIEDLEACKKYGYNLIKISRERINQELFKILAAPKLLLALNLMDKTGIFTLLFDTKFRDLSSLIELEKLLNVAPSSLRYIAYLSGNETPIWILKSEHKKYLLNFKDKIDINENNLLENLEKFGKEALLEILLVKLADPKLYQKLKSMPELVFPVLGRDLLAIGIKHEQIGDIIKNLRALWRESNYQLTKKELLSKI